MRDIPRYVKLIEKGIIDAQSVITKRYTLDQSRQAVQDTADRTIITGVTRVHVRGRDCGFFIAESQCSSALPSLIRHMSNQVVRVGL